MKEKERLPLRFGRNEFAGAFGDLGTDVPLIVLLILTCDLNAGRVLAIFGACQIFAGFAYRMPIPVQPLKAMAAIVIADSLSGAPRLSSGDLVGGGLAIGLIMLVLTLSGGLHVVERIIPKRVVRGLQFGLGIKLAMLGLKPYWPDGGGPVGAEVYVLGGVAFLIAVLLRGNRRFPAAPFLLALGLGYALAFAGGWTQVEPRLDLSFPKLQTPTLENLFTGLVVLAIPQLPLSLGNAVLATKQTVRDLFPGRDVSVRKLGLTYSICNLAAPLLGGIPVCHGSGGLAGHYAFGARTGGSAIIYGVTFLTLGLFFGSGSLTLMSIFPMAVLGVLLLFEAIALMQLSRDMAANTEDFLVVLVVALVAAGVPYGFCISMVVGVLLHAWLRWGRTGGGPAALAPEQPPGRLETEEGQA